MHRKVKNCLILGFVLSVMSDLLLLPAAGFLLLLTYVKKSFDPKQVKKDKTPILLLHGSGFCEAQSILVRDLGSVFSCNYGEGLASNHPHSGIERNCSKNTTNRPNYCWTLNGCYQKYSAFDQIHISTPWQGSPTIDYLNLQAKRYQQMSRNSGRPEHLQFRKDLVVRAKQADQKGERLHWKYMVAT